MMTSDLAAWAGRRDLIIIDGYDGTGKTTLARRLAADHGYRISHASLTPEGIDLFARYHAVIARPGRQVLDRSFISELVYGPLERGRSRLTANQAASLAVAVARRGGILVHLTCQPGQIAARLLARDGHAPAVPRIRAFTAAYAQVFAALADHVPVTLIDTTAVP
jgi:thymidylate kinase